MKVIENLLQKISNYDRYENFFEELMRVKAFRIVSFLNHHAIVIANSDSLFLKCLLSSDFLLVDGVALRVLCWFFRYPCQLNMNGSDLIPWLLKKLNDSKIAYKVLFIGSKDGLSEVLCKQYPTLHIKHINGYERQEIYIDLIDDYEPYLVIIGMGMPLQEKLANRLKSQFKNRDIIVMNGGAIIDYMAKVKVRAPVFLRKMNMEWFYRIIVEPNRMIRRYVVGGGKLLVLVLREKWTANE